MPRGGGARERAAALRPLPADGGLQRLRSTGASSGSSDFEWPTEYRYPDEIYRDTLDLEVGGERFELHHAKGETDDATWAWVPGTRVLCSGDLFIWATPNAGNPQKAQRYPREWAQALREMAELGAEVLLPGHGLPVVGAERVRDGARRTPRRCSSRWSSRRSR